MTYTAHTPQRTETRAELQQRIPGWGADLDPRDRPSVPRERFDPSATGAHWTTPERQEEKWPRERSIEHRNLTPVFGTATPPHGLSGVIRRYSYRKYSEARAGHWLLLVVADRVDAVESHFRSFATAHPDNPITESGVLSEFSRHGFSSRFGRKRADLNHVWLDPIVVAGPWLVAGGVIFSAVRALTKLGLGRRGGTVS